MKVTSTLGLICLGLIVACNTEKRVELDFSDPEIADSTGAIFVDGELFTGVGYTLNDSGSVKAEFRFVDGRKNGEFRNFSPSGNLLFTGSFKDGEKDGLWREYMNAETDQWEDTWSESATHFKELTYANGLQTGLTSIYRSEDSTLFKVYKEGINSNGESCYLDTVYEYFSSGALAAVTYYPDSNNVDTFMETYFENGNVEYQIQKHQHVPTRYQRMLRELNLANRKYNLDADLTAFSNDDSIVLKVISYQQFNEQGRKIKSFKGSPALEEAYSMLEDYLPLLQLQELTNLFGGSNSSLFGSSSSSSSGYSSYGSSSNSNSSSACHACNRSFNFKVWKGKAHGWSNVKESRPGYVKCGNCDGYGFTDEYDHFNYANPTTRKTCTNSRCQNGWLVCNSCYGKGSR